MNKRMGIAVLLIAVSLSAAAETKRETEFRDRPITDILLALGEIHGVAILTDETVTGRASCYLRAKSLDESLSMLLPAHHLYWWRDGAVVRVSRMWIRPSEMQNAFDVDADEVDVQGLVRGFSREASTPIVGDGLSGRRISIHARGLEPRAFMGILQERFPDIVVEWSGTACFVRRPAAGTKDSELLRRRSAAARSLTIEEGLYSLRAIEISFRDAVTVLVRHAGKQVIFLNTEDTILRDLQLENKPFEELLGLLLQLGSCGSSLDGETYVVYDIDNRDVLRQLDETAVIPLAYLSADRVPSLLPPALAGSTRLRVDPSSNSVILSGKPAETTPLERFIQRLDRPPANRQYVRFDLSFMKTDEFLRLLPAEFSRSTPLVVPGTQSFVLPVSVEQRRRLDLFIADVDRPPASEPIMLRHLLVRDLLENTPPGVAQEDIHTTADPSTFFFVGDRRRRSLLHRELAVLDRPRRQIRYELLVVQHRRGQNANREITLTSSTLESGDRNAMLGSIGKLLSLRFDIVSAFGYLFALSLNADLASARARILADTTLNGISGEQITFRNTDTYRYRDSVVNPDTGHLDPTGVVREITSGLIITIDGWVSGADVITMDISSTVSARGTDTSGSANALPSTTEKVITTHVRTTSGTPVVIGGLLERTSETRVDKVPLLGDLPLVGQLFQKRMTSNQDSELSVYILPHVERPTPEPSSLADRLRSIYDRLVVGAARD